MATSGSRQYEHRWEYRSGGRHFIQPDPGFQHIMSSLHGESLANTERVRLIQMIESLNSFSPLINRTRRRDIGSFTTRKPETRTVPFTPIQRQASQ
jgi:hypothetical protein